MGQRPVAAETVAAILQLKGQFSTRELARRFGVSSCTVSRIHSGKHRTEVNRDIDLEPGEERLATPRRCPQCGGTNAIWPCRACRAGDAILAALKRFGLWQGWCPNCGHANRELRPQGRLSCTRCGKLHLVLNRHLRKRVSRLANELYRAALQPPAAVDAPSR